MRRPGPGVHGHARRLSRPMARLLRAAATHRDFAHPLPARLLNGVDARAIGPAAEMHRVAGPVYLALRELERVPESTLVELRAAYQDGVARHLKAVAALRFVADTLGRSTRPWVVFKGPVLAAACYPRPDLRRYTDLDLLVRPRDLGQVVADLEAVDCEVLDRNWDFIDDQNIGEIHLKTSDGVYVDLHHDLVYDRAKRERFRVDVDAALTRATPVSVGTGEFPTFSPEDSVLHLALHSALAGADKLGWLMDVDQSLRRRPPDWNELTARAAEWRVNLVAHVILHRCAVVLGTPVPIEVLKQLASNAAWRAGVRLVHRLDPVERLAGGRSPSRTVARVASGDTTTSVQMLGRGLVRTASAPFGRGRAAVLANHVTALSYDSGGSERRDALFRRLASTESGEAIPP